MYNLKRVNFCSFRPGDTHSRIHQQGYGYGTKFMVRKLYQREQIFLKRSKIKDLKSGLQFFDLLLLFLYWLNMNVKKMTTIQ